MGEDRLILFVAYLVDNEYKSTTVRSYISAIKSVLQDDGVTLNADKYLLSSLAKACRLKNDTVQTRLPIRKNTLIMLLKFLKDLYPKQFYLETMYTALFTTAYFGLFRVGELTSGEHPILARDIHIGEKKDKLMFVLHTSKTHSKDARPQVVKISHMDFDYSTRIHVQNKICPYTNIENYLMCQKGFRSHTEPFFIFSDRSPVKPFHMCKTLKQLLSMAGLDQDLYDTYSTRISRAVDLHETIHLSVDTIKKLGRWKSNSVYLYLNF